MMDKTHSPQQIRIHSLTNLYLIPRDRKETTIIGNELSAQTIINPFEFVKVEYDWL